MDSITFHSSGKLLITGEYVVIDGAKALCLPTKKGQSITISKNDSGILKWTSLAPDGTPWLTAEINIKDWSIISCSNQQQTEYLIFVLKTALSFNINSIDKLSSGANITTQLDFPMDWGLGSSSTFLCNVAKWLDVDPFELHFKVSNGSGYDIAVGMNNQSLLYDIHNNIPSIKPVEFTPSFSEQLYFIHLNQKQVSSKEVEGYSERKKAIPLSEIINVITKLTNDILKCETIGKFEELLSLHEELISHVLGRKPIKHELFPDYSAGIVKSLGAWGGDFVLASARHHSDIEYFKSKGFSTIVPFSEMIS
ncbi:MAG: mevalonate kinase [Glaciecola sp.]